MRVTMDGGFVRKWIVILLSLVGVGWLGVPQVNAAQILYVVSSINADGTAGNVHDQEVVAHLVTGGHTVTLADDDTVSAGDLTGKDLALISSSVGSGAAGVNPLVRNTLKTSALPAVNYEPGLFDEFGWQTATVFNNPGLQTDIGITGVGASHPLGAGRPAGPPGDRIAGRRDHHWCGCPGRISPGRMGGGSPPAGFHRPAGRADPAA